MSENFGMPIPGETVLLFAGFLANQGKIRIVPAILVAIAGATVGSAGGFWLGWRAGPAVVTRFLQRFPRFAKQYDNAREMFRKHGPWAIFASRFITGLRVFAGVMAGALRMPFPTFLLFSFAGAVCWGTVIGYVGYLFGSNWAKLASVVGRMDRIVLAAIVGGALVLILVHRLRRRKLS
jgi:membrane protein DedA with SNARE-associated domain